jgi:hypothetical protein
VRAVATVLLATALLVPAAAAAAHPQAGTFAGNCSLSGPIQPVPAITLLPQAGSHFSFRGTGTCDGTIDGAAVAAAPVTLTFDDVATIFDTCELGPDFELAGPMTIGSGRRSARFDVTLDLARVAIAGPFTLRSAGGGLAAGTAQFAPADPAAAPQQCATGGVADASLSASFRTLAPLQGRRAARPARAPSSRARHRSGPRAPARVASPPS